MSGWYKSFRSRIQFFLRERKYMGVSNTYTATKLQVTIIKQPPRHNYQPKKISGRSRDSCIRLRARSFIAAPSFKPFGGLSNVSSFRVIRFRTERLSQYVASLCLGARAWNTSTSFRLLIPIITQNPAPVVSAKDSFSSSLVSRLSLCQCLARGSL